MKIKLTGYKRPRELHHDECVHHHIHHSVIGRNRPRADSKAGAKATDQVRIEGSVLLAFDRAGLVKLDQFAGNAVGFRVWVDGGFATSARI